MDCNFLYELIGYWAMNGQFPYEFTGFRLMDGYLPYVFIRHMEESVLTFSKVSLRLRRFLAPRPYALMNLSRVCFQERRAYY